MNYKLQITSLTSQNVIIPEGMNRLHTVIVILVSRQAIASLASIEILDGSIHRSLISPMDDMNCCSSFSPSLA